MFLVKILLFLRLFHAFLFPLNNFFVERNFVVLRKLFTARRQHMYEYWLTIVCLCHYLYADFLTLFQRMLL